MRIICAGLSKTGTKSLAKALRILGFTVYDHLEEYNCHFNEWVDLYGKGKLPDFATTYRDVDAVIALPAAFWFQEISDIFPDAKVILTVRDNEDVWVQSFKKQIEHTTTSGGFLNRFALNCLAPIFISEKPISWRFAVFLYPIIIAAFGSLDPKSTIVFKKKYREHNERVRAVIPREKLLIYNVKLGWKPLCEFLGCDVPDQEFPRVNVGTLMSKKFVSTRIQRIKRNVSVTIASFALLLSILYLVYS